MMNNLNELYDAILVGKLEDAVKVTKIAVEEVVLRLVKFLFRIF